MPLTAISARILVPLLITTLLTSATSCRAQGDSQPQSEATAVQRSPKAQVLIVFIFDEGCMISCKQVRPALRELAQQFGDRIQIIELNATPSALKETKKLAKSLKLMAFLSDSADNLPIVGFFDSRGRKVKELVGAKKKQVFQAEIEKILAAK